MVHFHFAKVDVLPGEKGSTQESVLISICCERMVQADDRARLQRPFVPSFNGLSHLILGEFDQNHTE